MQQLELAVQKLHEQKRTEAYSVISEATGTLFLFLEKISTNEIGNIVLPKINNALLQCMEAMEQQDDVLVADVIEYEVLPLLLQLGEIEPV